jgi:hypothetical protein
MVQLLSTIDQSSDKNIDLRIKLLECIGYFLVAIRNDKVLAEREYPGIIESLIQMHNLVDEDPHHSMVMIVLGQVSFCLKD